MPPQGPQLPPSLLAKRKREEDDDDTPSPDASEVSNENSGQIYGGSNRTKARAIGPTLPPANLTELPSAPPEEEISSSDDDDFGPSLPTGPRKPSKSPTVSENEANTAAKATATSTKPQRDEWMMIPPSDADWSSRVDPTKLRNRKFNTGKGAKGPSQIQERGVDAKWTETPTEKAARLEREMMGIKPKGEERNRVPKEKRNEVAVQKVREHSVRWSLV